MEDLSEQEMFQRTISRLFSDEAEVEISEGPYGHHARVTNIDGDEVQRVMDSIEITNKDLDFTVTETGKGLGMEIWTNE